jgi:hypothetical protein
LARQQEERVVIVAAHQTMLAPQEAWPVPLHTGVNLVGSSVQNNAGILSGFTASSYAKMPFYWTSGASRIEAVIKISVTSTTATQGIWGCVGSKDAFTPFYLHTQTNSISAYISSNGTQWNIEDMTSPSVPNVNYVYPLSTGEFILKITYSNLSGYSHFRHQSGAWVACGTISNTASPYGEAALVPQLGTNRGSNNPFLGTIDLNYTYLMRDGELWWEGVAGAYRNVKTTYPD